MDKSDYSEVKELITTNSNCPTNNSHFDGDSVVFYGAAKDDSFQKVSLSSSYNVVTFGILKNAPVQTLFFSLKFIDLKGTE